MDIRRPSRNGGERELLTGGRDRRTAARYFAREREKQDLRRERDAVMLRIAADLGVGGLAQQLDVTPAVVGKMLADARGRLYGGASESGPAITVRRARAGGGRWAELDTYYEALGSRPPVSPRRTPPPAQA